MRIFSDSREFARRLFPDVSDWAPTHPAFSGKNSGLNRLIGRLYNHAGVWTGESGGDDFGFAFLSRRVSASQYDLLLGMIREEAGLPGGLICLADEGRGFHGQRGRPWAAVSGNLHVTVLFRPQAKIPLFHAGWPALAAVSCVEAVDGLPGLRGRAGVKWVNDILIGGAKTAGFLAASRIKNDIVEAALLGIGINVRHAPGVAPDPFVPEVTSLRAHDSSAQPCTEAQVLALLLARLGLNRTSLLGGGAAALIEIYRQRSIVIGRRVRVLSDPLEGRPVEIASGVVERIGGDLELYIAGRREPVRHGRLILDPV